MNQDNVYSEYTTFLKKACEALESLGGLKQVSNPDNINRVVRNVLTAFKDQIRTSDTINDKSGLVIPANAINEQQKKAIMQCVSHLFIQEQYSKALRSYDELKKLTRYKIVFDGYNYLLENPFNKNERFAFLITKNQENPKKQIGDFIPESPMDIGMVLTKIKNYKININQELKHKPLYVVGDRYVDEFRLIRGICMSYGLNVRRSLDGVPIEPRSLGKAPDMMSLYNYLQINIPSPIQNSFDISTNLRIVRDKIRSINTNPSLTYEQIQELFKNEGALMKNEESRYDKYQETLELVLNNKRKIKKSNSLKITDFSAFEQDFIYLRYLPIVRDIGRYVGYGLPPYVKDFDSVHIRIRKSKDSSDYSVDFLGKDREGKLQLISGLTALIS